MAKGNPNHGKDGKFSSGGGSSGKKFTSSGGMSKKEAMAQAENLKKAGYPSVSVEKHGKGYKAVANDKGNFKGWVNPLVKRKK